jgi:hypothetical protein
MKEENRRKRKLIAKFSPYLKNDGGIFTFRKRGQLLGMEGLPGRKKTGKNEKTAENEFWYNTRRYVKNALIDLRLFVEVAGRKNVNQVITRDSLKPIVEALLWYPIVDHAEPNVNLAEIAQLLIEEGFGYLCGMFQFDSEHSISSSMRRTIADAIDGSKHLVFQVESLRKVAIEWHKMIAANAAEELKKRENKP